MASELCTALIVSEQQQLPNSSPQTASDTTTSKQVVSEIQPTTFELPYNQSMSDTSSVSEDKHLVVEPLHFDKPEISHTDYDVLMTEASEDVLPTPSNLSNQSFVNISNQEITITYENPKQQITLASVDETQAMDISASDIPEVVIT